jgi:hypothetical protein
MDGERWLAILPGLLGFGMVLASGWLGREFGTFRGNRRPQVARWFYVIVGLTIAGSALRILMGAKIIGE